MFKIAYIVSTLKRSGPTNQLSYIIKNLDRRKFKVILITLSPEPKDTMIEKFKDLGVEIISMNLSRLEGLFKAKGKILNILHKKKVDLIHTQGIRADILSANYLSSYKRVSTLRNYPWDDYPMKFGKLKGNLMAINHIKATRKIKESIACSKSISKIYGEKKEIDIKFIQNGVEESHFKRESPKNAIREKLKIPKDAVIYISVGSLILRKDPKLIINSFKKLTEKKKRILYFLGDGALKTELVDLTKDEENIKIIGNVNNVKEYLQASDYFISSSLSEGLPNTVIEAMACGLPCLLSDIEPHKEILEIDNKAGISFKQKDESDLTKKIYEIESCDYSEMSKSSGNVIKNQLNSVVMVRKYEEVYFDILGENNG